MKMGVHDWERVVKSIPNLPLEVPAWKVETGEDWSGDDAVWVWAILKDEDFEADVDRENREVIDRAVHQAVEQETGEPSPMVYVHFRTISESDDEPAD
jgi:hypothetical protein